MSILSRLFNVIKNDSSIVALPKHAFRQLLQHDDYDTYLFECAKKHIESLQKLINQKINNSPGFETLLRDVFAMC